ncbi:MAG: flavin reductase family protein [Firmicutes bacterium]|nr:flavin reductase family protein [Bacillota bacterium]
MRMNFGVKNWMYPMPVLMIATYNEDGTANVMNAAWGGILGADLIAICVDEGHKTTENIKVRNAFTVSFAGEANVVEADYVGLVSGKDLPNKLEKAGLHPVQSDFVDAPLIEEFPMTFECEVVSYDDETEILLGRIVNLSAREDILDETKSIDYQKFSPITYDPVNHKYIKLGEVVGQAFCDGNRI